MSLKETGIKLIEFGKPNKNGHVYQLDEMTREAIVSLRKREFVYSEFGFPKLNFYTSDERIDRASVVKKEMVCGKISNIRLAEDDSCLLGDFESWGPMAHHVPSLDKGYFGMRAIILLQEDQKACAKYIVTWDFILN